MRLDLTIRTPRPWSVSRERRAPICIVLVHAARPARERARDLRARLAEAIGEAGGLLGAIDLVRAERDETPVVDVTVLANDAEHMGRIAKAVHELDGIEVVNVSDRDVPDDLGGKIEIGLKVPLKTRDDLSMAYTPGVARVSSAIAADPE